jgi:RNA polymerase sigma-70 factor (ECF subfamily)
MTAPADNQKQNDAEVASSREVALLPPQVSSALALDATTAAWPVATNRSTAGEVELSDEALVAAIQRGDHGLGKQLYGRLIRVVDATLTRILGPGQAEHDDLVQATFEEVVRTIHKGQFQRRCRLTSWAASIACHIALNAIRRRKTERGIFDHSEDVGAPDLAHRPRHPENELEARDELRQLRVALATLSAGRAEAVLLHDAFGYDLSEVAALTNSTEAAVQSRLVRGRRDLHERMGLRSSEERKA